MHVATFVLGTISLFLGFATWYEDAAAGVTYSAYEWGSGLAPALTFTAGLVAPLAVVTPGTKRPGPVVPALSVAVTLEALFYLPAADSFTEVELQAGGVISLVANVLLAVVACVAFGLDARAQRPVPAAVAYH